MLRECTAIVDDHECKATFHKFGTRIVWGDDNMPHEESIAIVELEGGRVVIVKPDQVAFQDDPPLDDPA